MKLKLIRQLKIQGYQRKLKHCTKYINQNSIYFSYKNIHSEDFKVFR